MPLSDEISSRCYPYVETQENGLAERIHLLCLNCHLARIGATPAPGQNLDSLLMQQRNRGRRGSNGSSSVASSGDFGPTGSASPVHVYSPTPTSYGNKTIPGGRSSPFTTDRRGLSKPW